MVFTAPAIDMNTSRRTEVSLLLAILADASAGEIVHENRVNEKYKSEASLIRYVVKYLHKELDYGSASNSERKMIMDSFADVDFVECSICTQIRYLMFRPYWVSGDYYDRFKSIMFLAKDETSDHKALLNQILIELMEYGFDFDEATFVG